MCQSENPHRVKIPNPATLRPSSFERVDVPRTKLEVNTDNLKNRTIVVTNPNGTDFMEKEGMPTILVKFQEQHNNLDMTPGQLYNITLKEERGHQFEMLYFTSAAGGARGEVILLKWNDKLETLERVRTVAQGMNLQDAYKVDDGFTWTVEGIYKIRGQVKRGNAIETIRKDIKWLEKIKTLECKKNIRLQKKMDKLVSKAQSG